MRFSLAAISRALLVSVVFIAAALVLAPRSGAAVYDRHPTTATPTPCASTTVYCFEIVDFNQNDYNYVTGINNTQQIVGAYSSSGTAGSTYVSFRGKPNFSTQNQLSTYTLTSEQYLSLSTYIGGLDDGAFSNGLQVGYVVQAAQTKGVVRIPGSTPMWDLIPDPNHGSNNCAVTEVLAIHDSRIAVGFYETNGAGTTCVQHAFEVYSTASDGSFTPPYTFVDLAPTDPAGGTQDVTSSVATGINILGDVVGTVTWTKSTGGSQTGGWIYRFGKYTTFCYAGTTKRTVSGCSSTSSYPTYANGLDFSDLVVGNYTNASGHQKGFAILTPWKAMNATFSLINTNKANTVLWSTNQATGKNQTQFFAGWTLNDGARSDGIVGVCPVNHCGSTNGTPSPPADHRSDHPGGAYHD